MNDLEYPVAPVVGQDVFITSLSQNGIIANIIRYDAYGKWCCGVFNANTNQTLVYNCYKDKDSTTWSAIEYIPTRYPDEDGVIKRM